jgi:hypothetical protein
MRILLLNIKINLLSLQNRIEKLAKCSLFYLSLKLVQINYIFSDNVRILYIHLFTLFLQKPFMTYLLEITMYITTYEPLLSWYWTLQYLCIPLASTNKIHYYIINYMCTSDYWLRQCTYIVYSFVHIVFTETVYDISTGNNYVYHYVINDGIDVIGHTSIAFSVMACNDAHIARIETKFICPSRHTIINTCKIIK